MCERELEREGKKEKLCVGGGGRGVNVSDIIIIANYALPVGMYSVPLIEVLLLEKSFLENTAN